MIFAAWECHSCDVRGRTFHPNADSLVSCTDCGKEASVTARVTVGYDFNDEVSKGSRHIDD